MAKVVHERGRGVVATRAREDWPMRALLDNIPREKVASALEAHCQPGDNLNPGDKYYQMLCCMFDPAYKAFSLPKLARRFNITLKELTEVFRDAQIMEGIARMHNHVPDVMEDIAIDAKSKEEVCDRCNGSGTESDEKGHISSVKCRKCKGKRYVRVAGDDKARALLMEATGQTGRRGPLVAQQFNWSGGAPSLEDMIATTDKMLKGPVIEVEK